MTSPRTPDWVLGMGAWAMETAHRVLMDATEGRLGQRFGRNQSVELHTIGRKTGNRHTTLLTSPVYAPARLVLVASKGGSSDHPDWYKNLAANPDIEITVKGVTNAYHARTASAQEKSDLWPRILEAFPGYEGYQRNTDRDIPVVICESTSG
ncbi:nitroreductase family deazaflavin-dependent oxidoreductase [Mycobacterium sp. CBMA271]|uniref:nitroreductase/quinone reductase family protein n=1 Tax=unclassified Mycobacteroides TaxID=2618759 RepID=UPI0012DE685F|nr:MULTISPECIES: nitroreductase/quinone reductase family protein [unclassified Mycobacteroides]MUM17865.1 nitroreductase [Mycobacteroides sp. CBMA 326]MUM20436.1 nitroreductase family deazaflavin-dependent oxidoreductase [Mycobacteroides sp. CBMA 271]